MYCVRKEKIKLQIKKSYRFLSLFMAALLLLSSSGISMDVHFCQGTFKRANLFGKAKTCQEVSACAKKCGKSLQQSSCSPVGDHKDCCNNETVQLDFDFDSGEAKAKKIVDYNPIAFVVVPVVINCFFEDFPSYSNPIKDIPPLLIKDIPVFNQTFLL